MISLMGSSTLSARDRCFITVSALIAAKHDDHLPPYLVAARQQGINEYEIMEVIMQLAMVVGFKDCEMAIGMTREVFSNKEHQGVELAQVDREYCSG